MKHGKRPTREQKIFIRKSGKNPKNWLVIKDCKEFMIIMHRRTKNVRKLKRGEQA